MASVTATRSPSIAGTVDRRPRRRATFVVPCSLLLLCSLLFAPTLTHALELGPLNVHSTLGERLRADVEIASVGTEGLAGIRASLADIATYERFGVPRPDVLSSVAVSVVEGGSGTPIVRIGSTEPVHELFLNVLLRIEDRDIRLVREVAILLDPSVTDTGHVEGPSTTPDGATGSDAYTVRAGDSLMRIAERFAPPGTSAEQTAVAFYEANPEAFLGSIHRLIVGARLNPPTKDAARAHSPRAARAFIRAGIEDFKRRLAAASPRPGETASRGDDTAARTDLPDDEVVAGSRAITDTAVPSFEDDVALQDFQAVIVNLKGGLYELQGTLDERIERLDDLHSRVDELIGERVRIREAAERDAMAAEAAAEAAERLVEAAAANAVAATTRPDPEPAAAAPDASTSDAPARPIGVARSDDGDDAREDRKGGEGEAGRVAVLPETESGRPTASTDRYEVPPSDETRPAPEPARDVGPAATDGVTDTAPEGRDRPLPRTDVARTDVTRTAASDGDVSDDIDGPADIDGSTGLAIRDEPRDRPSRSRWSLAQWMQALRDGGLIVLALCMIHVLFSRRFRKRGDADGSGFDPEAAVDFYLRQSADQRMKADFLESVLADHPGRQDVRLQLLELYARDGSMTRFAAEAQAMYRMTRGNAPEWHRVVELGLELDADIDFYRMVIDDDPFDLELNLGLSDEDRISSVPGGTHVGRDGRGGRLEPIVSFEEFAAFRNSVARRDAEDLLSEAPELDLATDDDSPVPPVGAQEASTVAPVPLERRPIYVPEDAAELIAIAVNYTYGVEKLDIDLAGNAPDEVDDVEPPARASAAFAFASSVELATDEEGTRASPDRTESDGAFTDLTEDVHEPLVRHDDFIAEFVDFGAPADAGAMPAGADDDLMLDLEFRTDNVELKLSLAETYVDNDCHEEARKLIAEALPRADADQRRLADELLERIACSHVSGHAVG